jgi:hypothetical protein
MFVRFRQAGHKLQTSLIETRRVDGKVRHEHIASLGSIILPPSVADRITFWQRLHDRLAKLSNRVTAEDQGKVLGAVHAKVPMITADEQRALQLENARCPRAAAREGYAAYCAAGSLPNGRMKPDSHGHCRNAAGRRLG